MKTTISNESRAVIFGRYVDQIVLINSNEHLVKLTGNQILYASLGAHMASYLRLIPLSKISKEDAIQVARLKKKNIFKETDNDTPKTPKGLSELGVGICITQSLCWEGLQYLQLKGYATPQTVIENGEVITYSVDELVQLGVFKLNTTNRLKQ